MKRGRKPKDPTPYIKGNIETLRKKIEEIKSLAEKFHMLTHIDWQKWGDSMNLSRGELVYKILDQFIENRRLSALAHINFFSALVKVHDDVKYYGYFRIYSKMPSILPFFIDHELGNYKSDFQFVASRSAKEKIYESLKDEAYRISLDFTIWANKRAEASDNGQVDVLAFKPNPKTTKFQGLKPVLFNDISSSGMISFYGFENFLLVLENYDFEALAA